MEYKTATVNIINIYYSGSTVNGNAYYTVVFQTGKFPLKATTAKNGNINYTIRRFEGRKAKIIYKVTSAYNVIISEVKEA